MSDNIEKLYTAEAAKDPNNVLEQAINVYDDVFVIGWDKEGALDVRASLGLDMANTLFMLELFKHRLLRGDYNERIDGEL